MSEFTQDMRAIEAWGQAVHEANLKGAPLPKLDLPSCRKSLDRQENQTQALVQPQDDSQVVRA